ncbi:MAG: hypothetical protein HY000_36345, partial [Planctomycetes bacterium]|nr:hypothetical protein [Planctomycetota bacterium]
MSRNFFATTVAAFIMGALVLGYRFAAPPLGTSTTVLTATAAQAASPGGEEAALGTRTLGDVLSPQQTGVSRPEQGLTLFRQRIRPLLESTCLRCHDSSKRTGGLDLSRHATVLAGGDSGEAVVPGKPRESLLYQLVTAGEMPREANPLSPPEIAAIGQWIELGAPYEGEPVAFRGEPMAAANGSSTDAAAEKGGMCPCVQMMMGRGMKGRNANPWDQD